MPSSTDSAAGSPSRDRRSPPAKPARLPDGRDTTGEATESDDALLLSAAAYMDSAQRVTTPRKVQPAPAPVPTIPTGCVGLGCAIRMVLAGMAERCGKDRDCWQKEMENVGNETGQESA